MPGAPSIAFDWDPAKAEGNWRKHGVRFAEAMGVFLDALALTLIDEDGRAEEERWITLGQATTGSLLLVVHTWMELDHDRVAVRIISARRPTRREARQYRGIP